MKIDLFITPGAWCREVFFRRRQSMTTNKHSQHGFLVVMILSLAIVACQGVANLPNPFATATPTATATSTSTPTPLPTPTSTITPTPMPTGVKAEVQLDGTTLFTDYDNQYQVSLPEGWLVVPLNAEDLAKMMSNLAEANPDLSDTAKAFERLDANIFRMLSFNKDRKYITNGFATNLSVRVYDDKFSTSLPLNFVIGVLEDDLKQAHAKILSTDENLHTNPNGVEYGIIDFLQTTSTAAGNKVEVRIKSAVFTSNGKLILITLETPKIFGEEFSPTIDKLITTIKHLIHFMSS